MYGYVEPDNDVIRFQGPVFFYIPHTDMVQDGHAFDFPVCPHWVQRQGFFFHPIPHRNGMRCLQLVTLQCVMQKDTVGLFFPQPTGGGHAFDFAVCAY